MSKRKAPSSLELELRSELEKRSLNTSGLKAQLLERLPLKNDIAGESSSNNSSSCGLSAVNAFDVDSSSSSVGIYDEDVARGKRARTTVSSISEDLVCSISHELMVDPVFTLDGVTYERKEIEAWFQVNDTSPVTNIGLDAKTLIPNIIAKNTIAKLLASGELEEKVRKDWEERKRGVDLIRSQKLFDEDKIEDAAELGHPGAQGNMANRCWHGMDGQAMDYAKSVYWAKKAAAGGDKLGQRRLAKAYMSATGGLPKSYALAVEWFTKAGEQGSKSSMEWLGGIHSRGGHGVAKSMEAAVFWYRKAAENGSEFGQYNLGVCYYEGYGVTKSLYLARHWYQKSADQDYSSAQCALGMMLMKGEGGEQNVEEAGALWRKAAEMGDDDAQGNLDKLKVVWPVTIHELR